MAERTPKQNVLFNWEYKVHAMDTFDMPKHYVANISLEKYSRFTGYIKEWIFDLINRYDPRQAFSDLDIDADSFPMNWWSIAKDEADGKWVDNPLPRIQNASDENKKKVYAEIIPAYRALKESFDKRWWFEWIFNHGQYVAERDSIKALTGLMLSLTGGSYEEIDEALASHMADVPTSGVTAEERKAMIRASREERIEEIKYDRVNRKIDERKIDSFSGTDSVIGDEELFKIYNDITRGPMFNNIAKRKLKDEYGFKNEILEEALENLDGENIETEINGGKDRVIFENDDFCDIKDTSVIQEYVDIDNASFIEDVDEIGRDDDNLLIK